MEVVVVAVAVVVVLVVSSGSGICSGYACGGDSRSSKGRVKFTVLFAFKGFVS